MRKPALSLSCPARLFLPLFVCVFTLLTATRAKGQVKIGDNPNTINSNSALEIESTNKGFLPPRMAINSLNAVTPLTGTVPAGMLVYSSGGSVPDGYYFWNGTVWASVGGSNMTTKSASAPITKLETFVLASNDITLTLPVITAADNGLTISIKNIGTHTDLVTVKGAGTTTIDAKNTVALTRWVGKSFVAYGGNWVTKEKETALQSVLEVSPNSSWTTIAEAIEFLNNHMSEPAIIRLEAGTYEIDDKQIIDLDHPLTIQGVSYGKTTISRGSGVDTLFSGRTECYFKMLAFEGDAGTAIHLATGGEYFEVKDCSFTGFTKSVVATKNVEAWVFEVDFVDAADAGIEINAGSTDSVSLKVSEVDFINCAKGINLLSGNKGIISILNCTFYNQASQIGINYQPAGFTNFTSMFITNNAWNNAGSFFSGFDFSRTDGRDANAFIQNNAGEGDKHPTCRINVQNNNSFTSITNANTPYKAVWNNTSESTTKWTVDDNKITYQPSTKRNAIFHITGNISINNTETVSIYIIKNGVTTSRIGETDLRLTAATQPFQFSTVIYVENVQKNDYFELYCSTASGFKQVTFRDVQWFTDTK